MPHIVTLPDDLFAKLQAHAVPLVDTPLTVIERALAALEAGDEDAAQDSGVRSFNPAAPPNLSHTTPRKAVLAGKRIPANATYWNPIMNAVIQEAAERGISRQDILDLLTVNWVEGEKADMGYKFIEAAGISVQGQDANAAWRQAHRIAESFGIGLAVEFIWQNTEKAAMPNTMGSFFVEGN